MHGKRKIIIFMIVRKFNLFVDSRGREFKCFEAHYVRVVKEL